MRRSRVYSLLQDTSVPKAAKAEGLVNPFKGPSRYEKDDANAFFGRDKERGDLLRVISQNTLTLLYSKSGVGKSSMINAGIIPELNKLQSYFPVYIRVSDKMIEGDVKDYAQAIIRTIKEAAEKNKIQINTENIKTDKLTITEFIYLSEFTGPPAGPGKPGIKVIPVLIFDQFEEIFSLQFQKLSRTDLLADLTNMIENIIPEDLAVKLQNAAKEDELYVLKDKLQSSNKWYRVLFSFREEYLPRFQTLKEKMPSIFYTNGLFHLEPFTLDTAIEVIELISAESLRIDKETATHLAKIISNAEDNTVAFTTEVQPFFLSLVCKSIYFFIVGPYSKQEVIDALKDDNPEIVDSIIRNYRREVYKEIGFWTKRFIENNLVTEDGKRTMYASSDIKSSAIKKDFETLYTHSEFRFLNQVEYFNTPHYEILHDRLLTPIVNTKKKIRRIKKGLTWTSIIVLPIFILLVTQYYLSKEKEKIDRYDAFFTTNTDANFKNARKDLEADSLNTIAPFMGLMSYKQDIQNLPYFTSSGTFNTSKKMLTNFDDSVFAIFRNKHFLHTETRSGKTIFINSGFSYSEETTKDSIKIVLKKMQDTGTIEFGQINLKINNVIDKNQDQFYEDERPTVFASSNERTLCVRVKNEFRLYDLTRKRLDPQPFRTIYQKPYVSLNYFSDFGNNFIITKADTVIAYNMKNKDSAIFKGYDVYDVFTDANNQWYVLKRLYQPPTSLSDSSYYYYAIVRNNKMLPGLKGQSYGILNDLYFYLTNADSLIIVNRNDLSRRVIKTGLMEIAGINSLKTKNQFAVIDKSGKINVYSLSDLRLIHSRTNPIYKTADGTNLDYYYYNSFSSPNDEVILISYDNYLELYNTTKGTVEGFISSAYRVNSVLFMKDDALKFFGQNGDPVTWFYKIKPAEKVEDLEIIYDKLRKSPLTRDLIIHSHQ